MVTGQRSRPPPSVVVLDAAADVVEERDWLIDVGVAVF